MTKEFLTYSNIKVVCKSGVIILIIFLCPILSKAQSLSKENAVYEYYDSQYGLDIDLYRGRKYVPLVRYSVGNPFFTSEARETQERIDAILNMESTDKKMTLKFNQGKILIDKKMYSDVMLTYDVYNQEVVVQSKSLSGISNEIILLSSSIDEFWIGEHHFIKNPYEEIEALFIEKIEGKATDVVCYFIYEKEYRLQENSGKGEMGFGELTIKKYLYVNQILYRFKGQKRFFKSLSSLEKEAAILYVKSQASKFRNGNSLYFGSLLNTLSGKNSADE